MKACADCSMMEDRTPYGTNPGRGEWVREYAFCRATLHPVHGRGEKRCLDQRLEGGACGPEGRLFQPRRRRWFR